jgi:adenine/guanine phosphoribosyltransferase-like PRPP-binding protein
MGIDARSSAIVISSGAEPCIFPPANGARKMDCFVAALLAVTGLAGQRAGHAISSPEDFWQSLLPAGEGFNAPYEDRFPAQFGDGRKLLLPIRPLPDGRRALASLIINQASFLVLDAIATDLAGGLTPFGPEIIVGLPTLGLTLAAAVAQKLGATRYVPLGTSRKFWYRDELSVPLSSVTSPEQTKRLYIDPRMVPLLEGRRVALVDDVISSGVSMRAGILLLAGIGVEPVALGAAMLQSAAWQDVLFPEWAGRMAHVFSSPVLMKTEAGWVG